MNNKSHKLTLSAMERWKKTIDLKRTIKEGRQRRLSQSLTILMWIILIQLGLSNIVNLDFVYLANIFRGRIEYELIYSLRGAKHRVDYSVHIR